MREREADKILDNIIQLAELLDEEALRNADGIHFIELARSVSLKKRRKAHGHNSIRPVTTVRSKEKESSDTVGDRRPEYRSHIASGHLPPSSLAPTRRPR
jgi:hypothetical protein